MLYCSPDPRLQPRQTISWYTKISPFCFWLNLFEDQKQELNYTGSDLVMIYVQKEIQGTNLHHPTIINQDGAGRQHYSSLLEDCEFTNKSVWR